MRLLLLATSKNLATLVYPMAVIRDASNCVSSSPTRWRNPITSAPRVRACWMCVLCAQIYDCTQRYQSVGQTDQLGRRSTCGALRLRTTKTCKTTSGLMLMLVALEPTVCMQGYGRTGFWKRTYSSRHADHLGDRSDADRVLDHSITRSSSAFRRFC